MCALDVLWRQRAIFAPAKRLVQHCTVWKAEYIATRLPSCVCLNTTFDVTVYADTWPQCWRNCYSSSSSSSILSACIYATWCCTQWRRADACVQRAMDNSESRNKQINEPCGVQSSPECVAIPSLIAARLVGRNSGPIFCRLWTKVQQIKYTCAEVIAVCNAVFLLTISCCFRSWQNFDVLGCQFWGMRNPKFLTEFYKAGSSPNTCMQILVTIDRETSEIRRWKKQIEH